MHELPNGLYRLIYIMLTLIIIQQQQQQQQQHNLY